MNSPLHSYLKTTLLGALLMGICAINTDAQTHKGNVWSPVKEGDIPKVGTRYITPTKYQTFRLDLAALENILMAAPMERTPIASVTQTRLQMPMPDGTMQSFDVVESPIMEPALSAQFPEIKTYAAVGIDNPGIYVRFDLTPQGFHAMMLIPGESTVYIDPYSFGGGDVLNYIVYDREHFHTPIDKEWACYTVAPPSHNNNHNPPPNIKMFGTCELRTYRLALSATGEYTAFHGGTVALAQAAQVTTMNRVNGVFERDMAVRMNIVANNNLIVYTNAGSDPFTNGSPGNMINENQTNTNTVIGNTNYDIGHVFGTNSGGLAGLGVVCITNQKARGVTGSSAPIGDPFDIDYVAHEMGHQFDCNHTFNSASGSCGGGNRNDPTAYEPGSGVTIMAYAGICSPHNVLNNSIDHFHGGSLQEMGAFVTSGTHTCPVKTPLANAAPTITSPTGSTTYTIPASTMFFLTATATDPNPANVLTYCWETMDNGISGAQPPAANEPNGPMFRSYSPSTSPTRYFPRLSDVIAGTVSTWEVLPSATRSMDFRVTVRDNAAGGGCNDHEDVTVNVQGGTGPFVVTSPSNTGITWPGNTNQTVTWNVAGTTGAPISCANVSILLSTDGGLTYPTVLLASTPNDGSQTVLCPNTPSTTARIMVVCADNIFFDISNNNFTITAATNDYTLAATSTTVSICAPSNATYTINIGSIGGYNSPVTLNLTGAPVGTTTSFSTNPVTPAGTSTLTIGNTGGVSAGTYNMTLTATSVSGTKTLGLTLVVATAPSTVTLTTPTNGATNQSLTPAFAWGAVSGSGITYQIDIATDAGFASIVQTASGLTTNSYTASPALNINTTYFWRVRAISACGNGTYSSTFSFTTGNTACTTIAATTIPVAISASGTPTVTSTIPVSLPAGAVITDVNILNLTGTHTYVSDLTVRITSPAGTVVNLFSGLCNDNDNFNLNFDASGALYTTIPCPPTSGGTFQPQGNLGNFTGQNPNGTWTLTVVDGFNQDGGSLNTWSLNICYSVPASCAVTATTTATNATCNGVCNGTATTAATGGTAPYTFVWSNAATTASITGLCAGVYTVTVTDAATCTATAVVTIAQPTAVTATATSTNLTCNGVCNGTASVNAAGGTAPHTFSWSNGATTASITGLCAGTYTVTVRDANNCSTTATRTITQPTAIAIATTSIPTTCAPNSGAASATATGGTGALTYFWSNSISGGNNPNLNAGTYTVTVTDANGCTASASVVVANGCTPCTLTGSTSSTNVTCNGACNGTAVAVPASGTSPYTFAWSNGTTSASATGLCAGTYTVTVTDAAACTALFTVVMSQPATLSAAVFGTNANCNAACDGTANATATGGTSPYTFLWSNGVTTAAVTGLCAGTYTVTVRDANNCSVTAIRTVTQPLLLVATTTPSNATCNGCSNGSATASVTGGTGAVSYLWAASAGSQTTATATGLAAGVYCVTATDANGCTSSSCATITEPAVGCSMTTTAVAALFNGANTSCFGACNGQATATTTGGTGAVGFVWSNSQTSSTATGLCAGTYTVTATDAAACTASATVVLTSPAPVNVAAIVLSNVSCNGGSNASATATATGGVGTYTYVWSPSLQITQTATGLAVGTNCVSVTDANGCQAVGCCLPTQPATSVAAATTGTNLTCNGVCNGTATAAATGGTAPYTFLWSNGATTANITGLCAGVYTVTVRDANNCSATSTRTITQPTPITIATTSIPTTCSPNSGAASATATGGTGALTYLWSNSISGGNNPNLNAGTYIVTVTDANGCTASATVVVANGCGSCIMSVSIVNPVNPSCNGVCNGFAVAVPSNGTAPYTYLWSNGTTNASNTNLCAGVHSVTVTDAAACTATALVTLTQPTPMTVVSTGNNILCNGQCTGFAAVSATGGTAPYTFAWSNGATVPTINGLCAGTYTVTVTDANGCTASTTRTITQPALLTSSTTATATTCAPNSGTATTAPSGGTAPYTFLWSTGATTQSVTGLSATTYTVTITDANGCQLVHPITVVNGCACNVFANATVVNNVSCNGLCNGGAFVVPSGGTAPYTYLWSNGFNQQTVANLCAGNHTVTVTAANGCTATATVTITQPVPVVNTAFVTTGITCNGQCSGVITTVATGGTGTYTHLWSNGATGTNNGNVCAGIYTVTATDVNGCTAVATATLAQPAAIVAVTTSTPTSCSPNSGSAIVTATGGTPPYSYAWSNGTTTPNNPNLSAGTYMVTIMDANNCSLVKTVVVANGCPCNIQVTSTSTLPSCNGGCNGGINITVTNALAPMTFLWSNGATTEDISNVCAGVYTVQIVDANGCTSFTTHIVNTPAALSVNAASTVNATCDGNNGVVAALVNGGTSPFTFVWSTGATGQTLSGVNAGTYTVTATDVNGCTGTGSAAVGLQNNLSVSNPIVVQNPTCAGNNNGSAMVVASGPANISYLWDNGETTATAVALSAGVHTVTVSTPGGCTVVRTVVLTATSGIQTTAQINATQCVNGSGQATVIPFGGSSPYSFAWNTGATTFTVTGLNSGTYTVTITDAVGCTASAAVTITIAAPPALTATTTSPVCAGQSTGAINLSVAPAGNYTFTWTNGATTEDLTNIPQGTYVVNVTDPLTGCASLLTTVVTGPNALILNTTQTEPTTPTSPDGSIAATANGGTAPYTYLWNTGATSPVLQGITSGSYSVTVTDANGCQASTIINLGSLLGIDTPTDVLQNFVVMPNPNNGHFNVLIEWLQTQEATLRVVDVLGRVLHESHLNGQSFLIPMQADNWASGTYFVELISRDKMVTRKVIINSL